MVNIMKTYIAPKTENVMFGTSYLMQDPVITMNSTSGGFGQLNDATQID